MQLAASTNRDRVVVGVLHSLTGPMAAAEKHLVQAVLMAVEEINGAGGVLGSQVVAVVEDGGSDPAKFASAAASLVERSGACAVFGCWTSSSRKAVKPVVENLGSVLWYPVQYEGLEESPRTIYAGSCLNQQICPAVEWAMGQGARSFFLIGSDYVFPRVAGNLIRTMVAQAEGRIVGESYEPLGSTDFAGVAEEIGVSGADMVFNTINGEGNLAFFKALHAARAGGDGAPVMSFSFSEIELAEIKEEAAGHYACWSYFKGLDTPKNRDFVARCAAWAGGPIAVSDPVATAYAQVYLWKQAVEAAGSTDPDAVLVQAPSTVFDGLGGAVEILANHHVRKPALIGRARSDGEFDVVWESDGPIEPKPWLGVEDAGIRHHALVREVMAQYPEALHLTTLLFAEIARREALERELVAAREKAELADKAKSVFLATMSHELRTPLNPIIGYAQLMQFGEVNPEHRQYLDSIIRAGEQLISTINDVLDYSKIEAGHIDLQKKPFDVGALVSDVGALFAINARDKGLSLSCEYTGATCPDLIGDAVRIRQVLVNLVGNAIKFTSAGHVTIRYSVRPVSGGAASHCLLVQVSDTGIGIAPDETAQLFQPFFQANDGIYSRFRGTGLGLAISRKIVEAMGGTISVQSVQGGGSVFHFSIPLAVSVEPERAGSPGASQAAELVEPLRVLVVDDNAVNLDLMAALVVKLGHGTPVKAGGGEEAVAALSAGEFDAIITDIQMPLISGYDLARRIREGEWGETNRKAMIVAATACAMPDDEEKCLSAGIHHYLSKPIRFSVLRDIMASCRAAQGG